MKCWPWLPVAYAEASAAHLGRVQAQLAEPARACCGVGCYHGICWRAFEEQWSALRRTASPTAILLSCGEFDRDLDRFGPSGGWIEFALRAGAATPLDSQARSR